jgi:hypothetical protein
MQGYNFADPALGNPIPRTVPYVARWANAAATSVPEPGSVALVGIALAALARSRGRVQR